MQLVCMTGDAPAYCAAADEEEQRLMERCCWEPRRLELLQGAVVRQVWSVVLYCGAGGAWVGCA